MIVVMKHGASPQQIDHVIERIEQLGLRSHVIVGTECTVIAALGEKRDGAKQALETGEGVEKVVPILAPYKMASTEVKQERTLVEARDHVTMVASYADVLQVGARNMQNYPLLEAVGEAELPVLLKRGPAATLDEFLLAAEYVLKTGNTRVMLCERGIRTFEDHTRFTLPLATVPYLHQTTHLPVVVDPSHGTRKASLVATMARAAIAAGADGVRVEVHPDPDKALSEGSQ